MVVQVVTDGQISHDPEDILSVIGDGHRVMGVGHMDNDQKSGSNDGLFYITIYNDQNALTPLQFEFFDASTGNIHIVDSQIENINSYRSDKKEMMAKDNEKKVHQLFELREQARHHTPPHCSPTQTFPSAKSA